jgi:hypothetical protein
VTKSLTTQLILSVMTASLGYVGAAKACAVWAMVAMAFEYFWIQIVYQRFPVLQIDEENFRHKRRRQQAKSREESLGLLSMDGGEGDGEGELVGEMEASDPKGLMANVRVEIAAWREFSAMPIFWSEFGCGVVMCECSELCNLVVLCEVTESERGVVVSYSYRYYNSRERANQPAVSTASMCNITTLAMDGMGVSYFKIQRGRSDAFLAIIRGLVVLACFIGTAVMPAAERRWGSRKLGLYGLFENWAVVIPTVAACLVDAGVPGTPGPVFSSIMMFGGIILSRPGQLLFDLSQLKQLQVALEHHPNRNRLTAMQSSLQSLASLTKFTICLVLSDPANFKYTALITWLALSIGMVWYIVYLRHTGTRSWAKLLPE